MMLKGIATLSLAFTLAQICPAQPIIKSLAPDGNLLWTNNDIPGIAIIERSTNLEAGSWKPFFYDVASNGLRSTWLPATTENHAYFRIAIQTNVPDPTLLLHLPFDNDFSNGTILDISGYAHDGLRFGKPLYPTNWPSPSIGPDGSRAGEFHWYVDEYGEFNKSGDYVGITNVDGLMNLPQATIACWGHYFLAPGGNLTLENNATFISAGYSLPGAWQLGRTYGQNTRFTITTNQNLSDDFISFPDLTQATGGESGGWHHYAVTFSNGLVKIYFDGTNCGSRLMLVTNLTVGHYSWVSPWIALGCWTHDGTPPLEDELPGNDYPNNGWLNGTIDDVRIYNRVLTPEEILALYASFDQVPPSTPDGVNARAAASTQIELRWNSSTDNFRIAGYRVRRDNAIVGQPAGASFCDTGLAPETAYEYSVAAVDVGGSVSAWSSPISIQTSASGATIDVIVDDADSEPSLLQSGTWYPLTSAPGYFGTQCLYDNKTGKGKTLTYTPVLPEAGVYDVYVRYPGSRTVWPYYYLMDAAVPLDILHAGVTNTVFVNQQTNYAKWNLLGSFSFDAGTNGSVQIRTAGTTGYVLGDALRFVK